MNCRRLTFLSARCAALTVVALVICGCSLTQPNPAKQSYLLEPVRTGAARTDSSKLQLQVRNIQIAAPFEGKGFVYRTSEFGYQADFYHEFLTAPRTLIGGHLQAWLSASKVFRNVLPSGSASEATHLLDSNISHLYGDFQNPTSPTAVVAMEFFLSNNRAAAPEVVVHKNYCQAVKIASRQPEALAKGWSQALEKIFAEFEQDLADAKLQ